MLKEEYSFGGGLTGCIGFNSCRVVSEFYFGDGALVPENW